MITDMVLQNVQQVGDDWMLSANVPERLMSMIDESNVDQAIEYTTDLRLLEAFFAKKGAHEVWEKLRQLSAYGINRIVQLKQGSETREEQKSKEWSQWAAAQTAPPEKIEPTENDRSLKSLLTERGLLGGPRPRVKKK